MHFEVDLRENIHLTNKSATPITRAVGMPVSPWWGRLISHEHVIKANSICNMQRLSNQRSAESPICKSSSWNTIYFSAEGKVITQAQMPVCGKESEQDGAWENFRGTSFLESGFLFSLSEAMWQTTGEILKASTNSYAKNYGNVKKSQMIFICFVSILI